MKKRMISLWLAIAVLVGMLPSSAFAAGGLLRAFAVNAVNATVYNEDGEVIKAAYPGDTVRVVGTPPVTSAQTFNGWTVETADVQYTENGQELTFVMPSKAVNITANYLDWCVDSVCFDIDVFIVGDSIPFDISISDNGVDTIGYTLGVPDGIDTSVTYNNIRWYDNTQKSYCRPGDVFQKGHEYTVYIGIMAEENCCFESGADLTVDFGYYGTKSGLGSEYSSFDSTKWLMVSKGNIKPAAGIFDIELKNAVAYDSDGNSITKALSGEAVTVSISKPFNGCGDFDKWIVEPSSLEYTFKNGIFSFVMPECDVSLTADFKSLEISNVYIYIGGPFSAGDEIPFTFSTVDGQMWHIGYGAGAPPTADTTNFYNNMSWFDATAEEYKKPGDVFEDGHEYNLTVNVKANEYCHFADAFQMTVSFGKYGISDYTPGTYAGEDESKYIYVQLDGVKTYKEYSIALKNCIARNDAGESITSALPGESVNVVLNAPLQCGDFLGWSISPDIEYTIEYGILKFTMPYDDVEVTADFDTMVCNKIYLDIGKDYMPGDEIPFTAYFMDGQMYYTGYYLKAPAGIDSSVIYNGISWLDTTTGEYAKPGDKFKADHVYKVIIHLAAAEYRHFDALENMELKIAYLQGISAELHEYDDADPSRWLYATVDNITTISVPKKQINITNGVAYNADGEVITSAYAGDVITITAVDTTGVRTFRWWYDTDYVGDITFEDKNAQTTTFVMPDRDVNIYASFNPREIKDISFELNGFYQLNNSDRMELSVISDHEGFSVVNNNGRNYKLHTDDGNGKPTTYEYSGALYGYVYWLSVEITANEGYALVTQGGTVTLTVNGQTLHSSMTTYYPDYSRTIYNFKLDQPIAVEKYDIYVNGGFATQYGYETTSAPAGTKVYLTPDENTDEAVFDKWVVSYGDVELLTDEDGKTYFIMPENYVGFEAIFKGAVHTVYINDIDIPTLGATPDYTATLFENCGYSIIQRSDRINGISWWENISPLETRKLDPATDVFEEGKTYMLLLGLQAESGYWFGTSENGESTVSAFVNGYLARVGAYKGDTIQSINVMIDFTIPKAYNITIDGGNAYDPRGSASGSPVETDGEPITKAMPGTYVKAVADIPEGYEFVCWEIVEGQFKIDESALYESTLWFDMPECDVHLIAHIKHTQHELDVYGYNNDIHWQICTCGERIPNSESEHNWNEEKYCICGAKGYDVQFFFEGDEYPIFGVKVIENMTVSEPAQPEQEDKIFIGWFTENGDKYDFGAPVTTDLKLYARFVSDISVISVGLINYEIDGRVITVDHDAPCKVLCITDNGYMSVSAVDNGDGTYSFEIPVGIKKIMLRMSCDGNGDAVVNGKDLIRLKKQLLNGDAVINDAIFDYNCDGEVNEADAEYLVSFL